jgi:outer membrane protein, heavy metal efflux system
MYWPISDPFRALAHATLVVHLAVVGCASPAWDTSWPEPRPLGREILTIRPSREPDEAERSYSTPDDPNGVLTLSDALALALERNPDLAAFSWEVRAAEARTLQAGLRPNPEISVELEDVAGSGQFRSFDQAQTTVQLSQLIETAGKRLKRRRVAGFDQDLFGWDYETARMDVFTDTARRFVTVLAAQEQLALSEELLRLSREALETVRLRVREGAASPVEQTRAEVAVSAEQVARNQAIADLETSRIEIAALWGSRSPLFSTVEANLYRSSAPPPVEAVLARAEQNPDLARWTTEIALREAAVDLEDARRFPNVTAGIGPRYISDTNDTALVAGISVPIPLFDRNQGQALAARYELARTRQAQRAAENRVRTALRASHQRVSAAHQRVSTISRESLPGAEAAYAQTLNAYRRGLFRYLDVLDAQRTLFGLRASYIEALESYHGAVADLERLSGEPLRGAAAQP